MALISQSFSDEKGESEAFGYLLSVTGSVENAKIGN
jgi:hypothetical protein